MAEVSEGWSDTGRVLAKNFSFDSYRQTVDFVGKLTAVIDFHEHHPEVSFNERTVRVRCSTLGGTVRGKVTQKDRSLAKDIDGLYHRLSLKLR